MPVAEPVKHLRLLLNVSVMDMGSQTELFDFITVNGSGEPAPDREASYAILAVELVYF